MPHQPCPHVCICNCTIHDPTSQVEHITYCCKHICPVCDEHILEGMINDHLRYCHGMTTGEAQKAIVNPISSFLDKWATGH